MYIHNGSLSALTIRTIIKQKKKKTLKYQFKLFFMLFNYIILYYNMHYSDILSVVRFDSSNRRMNRATGYSS